METVVHIEITPDVHAKLTPLELLEDFADASRDWQYLDGASDHYAQLKKRPACILRHRRDGVPHFVDLGFAATNPDDTSDIELIILDTPSPEQRLGLAERNQVVDDFIQRFRQYLASRPRHATLHVEKEDVEPSKTPVRANA